MEGYLGHNAQVALYARVSTEEQREGQTIDSQVAELERFAREQRWAVVDVYRDEGWSGSLLARPALDQLRDEASKGRFQAVLINDVDRLARDVTHLGIVKRDLERHGLRVIFRKLPAENSPTQNLMVNVLGSFAEFERELIADRTRRGRRHKVEVRKQFLGSIPPYGFRYIRKDRATGTEGKLEVEPEEAGVVRQMYAWVDKEGLSARRVVAQLNRLYVHARKGRPTWARSSVLRILRSETYAGVWHYNKLETCTPKNPRNLAKYRKSPKSSVRFRPHSDWLPLVLPESLHMIARTQWERVQQQLDRNITFSPRNGKHVYLLSGLVRCGACGARYVGQPCHGRFYYRCLARCRKLPTVNETQLDDTVWHAVENAVLDPAIIADQVAQLSEARTATIDETARQTTELRQALKQLQKEEGRVVEAYRLGILSSVQLRRELESLNRRRASVEDRQAALSEEVQTFSAPVVKRSITDYCKLAAERLEGLAATDRQQFLRFLVREIIFEAARIRIRGVIPITTADAGKPIVPDGRHCPVFASNIATTTIADYVRRRRQ